MKNYVTDTHALLWHLSKDSRLSLTAKAIFQKADSGTETIIVPSIVLVECLYLIEKKKIEEIRLAQILEKLSHPQYTYKLSQIDINTITALKKVERKQVPDMPDRIITATALQLNIPLITRDEKIKDIEGLLTIW